MRKKAFLIIAAILLCVSNIMAQVASGVCGDNITWELTDDGELVIEGTGEMYNYSNNSAAPWSSYKGSIKSINIKDGVTSVGSWAFAGCSALTDVSISESVTIISNNAFRECSILEEITFPTGLTQLGAEVFYECRNLKTATLPEGLSSIETSTFYHCGNLQSVVIPKSVTSLGWGVFFGCEKLTSVTSNATTPPSCSDTSFFAFNIAACTLYVPDESVSAYQQANYWKDFTKPLASGTCGDNLTWRLTYGDELVIEGTGEMTSAPWFEIEKYRFAIKKATIKEGVTSIAKEAFHYCTSLASISIPESMISIGDHAFRYCVSLTSVVVPEGVTSIGKELFQNCNNLTEVNIPEGVISIGQSAFEGCKISTITIPENVSSIDAYAFYECSNLTSITSNAATPPTLGNGVFNGVSSSIPVYVPAVSVDAYKEADGWSAFSNIQPIIIASGTCGDNLTWKYLDGNELVIEGTGEMYNYSSNPAAPWSSYSGSIKSVNIEDGVTSIGSWAFAQCSALTDVSISESVTTIGGDAFRECSILEEINLPTGLTQLGTGVFLYCDALRRITVPEGVTKIGSDTFEFCPNLSSITFPSGLTEIGPWALKGAYNLASITCKATTPPSLGSEVFSGVNNSIPVYVPASSVEAYKAANGWSAFTNIQPITIASGTCGEGLTWQIIDSGELIIEGTGEMTSAPWSEYKEQIYKITIKEGVTSICDGAFRDCNKVVTMTIPKGVTRLGWDVFFGCTGELYLNSLPNDDMMYDLFYGSKLTRIVVGEGISVIGRYIFADLYNVTEIVLPESLTTIEDMAFMYCQNLTTITIPANVTSIGTYAFDGCTGLTSIICKGTVPPVCGGNLFYNNKPEMTLFVPITATSNYKSATQWKDFDYIVGTAECGEELTCELWPDGKLLIEGEGDITSAPWSTCVELVKELVIEEGVTGIADEAFNNFENLLSITSHAEVPPLCNAGAFANVDKTTPVYVPADKLELYSEAEGWSEFINLTSNDSRILLDNFAKYSNVADEDFDEITYKRTFNNTEWQALYVPFEIPVTEEFLAEFEVADLNDIRQYDRDDDGVADETVVEAFKITDGILEANYPYLIRAKETGEKNIIVTDATLYATKENSIDCSSVHERYTFTPTYSTIAASSLTGRYALSSGVWQPIADDASLGAFRFYLSIESRDGNMQAAQNIRMLVIGKDTGDDTTTGIGSISDTENEDPEMIYDMQGRRVTKPNKGIYIVNGKKVFIK